MTILPSPRISSFVFLWSLRTTLFSSETAAAFSNVPSFASNRVQFAGTPHFDSSICRQRVTPSSVSSSSQSRRFGGHVETKLGCRGSPPAGCGIVKGRRRSLHSVSLRATQRTPSDSDVSQRRQQEQQQKPAEFDMQELRAQLGGMVKAGLGSADLTPAKRGEIEGYVANVVRKCPSPVDLSTLGRDERLVGTWRLGFSTESAALSILPKEARVLVRIDGLPDEETGRGKLDYVLKFTEKVLGLRGITAESDYWVDPGPVSPGLLTFVYDRITSDMFGMTLPMGLFGLLKGRANYIETLYFDGSYWIERGYSPEGMEYYNVYFKEREES